jgi:hypothetical protein
VADIQFRLGEGPCIEAHTRATAVLEEDLGDVDRWPAHARAALAAGVRAVFVFPLRMGGISLGALELSRRTVGMLTHEELEDALVVADIATVVVLDLQAQVPPGRDSELGLLAQVDVRHTHVHQATGMISAQLGVTVADAMAKLRTNAFGSDRSIYEVAHDVVGGRLRFS